MSQSREKSIDYCSKIAFLMLSVTCADVYVPCVRKYAGVSLTLLSSTGKDALSMNRGLQSGVHSCEIRTELQTLTSAEKSLLLCVQNFSSSSTPPSHTTVNSN